MTGRPNGAARAAGPEGGIRVTHGYAGHRCDGRLLASGDPNCPNGGASGLSGLRIRILASLGAFVALGKALS